MGFAGKADAGGFHAELSRLTHLLSVRALRRNTVGVPGMMSDRPGALLNPDERRLVDFYRINAADRQRVVSSQRGGTIAAGNRADRSGAMFIVT